MYLTDLRPVDGACQSDFEEVTVVVVVVLIVVFLYCCVVVFRILYIGLHIVTLISVTICSPIFFIW